MFLGSESDRLALRELIDSYGDAVMRNDPESWIDMWTDNATWIFRDRTITGRSDILNTWKRAMEGFREVLFMAQPGSVVVDGNRATMVTHTFEHLVLANGTSKLQAGIYSDEAIKADKWRFVSRQFSPRELKI